MKNKLRKEVKSILFGIICLIVILFIAFFLNKNKIRENTNKNLAGQKIANGLYKYNFKDKNSIQNIIIKDNKIYYITNNENIYKLYKKDIYTNITKEIGTIESDMCLLYEYYLLCFKGEETIVYDIDLKEIYKSDKEFSIVPYQNSFLIVRDKEIYLNNKKIRTIRDDIERFDIIKYYVSDDNTFIEFVSINDTYIYNVKEDTYEKFNIENMYLYEKGFYYSTIDKIIVKNLDNNLTKEYNNFKNEDEFSLSAIKDNLYFYIDNKNLKIYDLETNKFKYLDYKFMNSMDQMILKDNYLYIIYQGENPEIYIVKLDEIDSKYYTEDEFKEVQKDKLSKRVTKIENKYNDIYIVYNMDDIKDSDKWISEYVNEDRYDQIDDALDSIDKVLSKFNSEFLSTFRHDNYQGLRIVIVKGIITGADAGVVDISGQTFSTDKYYNIIITNNGVPYERVLWHEMMHAIDDNASNHKYDIAGNWYDYNPKDFEYNIKHYNNNDIEYTTYGYNEEEIYFVDAYSKVNQYEDRARIFENMCYIDGENIIIKYPNLLKKAEYIRDELVKYYPSLKNSKVFDNIEIEE